MMEKFYHHLKFQIEPKDFLTHWQYDKYDKLRLALSQWAICLFNSEIYKAKNSLPLKC